jgi:hypothetical protein
LLPTLQLTFKALQCLQRVYASVYNSDESEHTLLAIAAIKMKKEVKKQQKIWIDG